MANAAAILRVERRMGHAYLAVRDIAVDYGRKAHNREQNAQRRAVEFVFAVGVGKSVARSVHPAAVSPRCCAQLPDLSPLARGRLS